MRRQASIPFIAKAFIFVILTAIALKFAVIASVIFAFYITARL